MKIISWNCNGKFREKFKQIVSYDADIYVIQECKDLQTCKNDEYKEFARNSLWIGDNKSRGLGIFAKDNISLVKHGWDPYCLKLFLPVRVNDYIDLVGVWTKGAYIEEYYIYQSFHINKYTEHTVLVGDFNSNAIWDSKHRGRSHSDVVNELAKIGIVSAYHYFSGEAQGQETQATYYHHRHLDKPFYIDYCFCSPNLMSECSVLASEEWLSYSDHIPIILELK